MTFYLTTSAGWGNISLSLSDYVYKTDKPRVHRKLLDVVKCIDFKGLEFTDNDDEQAYEKRIAINSFTYNLSLIHTRAHETVLDLVCRLLLEKKKKKKQNNTNHKT